MNWLSKRLPGNCPKCGTYRQSLHRDHILPKCKGGTDDESNLQYLCANCHEDKTREDMKGVNKGRVHSSEVRARMSAAHLGRKRTKDHCDAIAIAVANRPPPSVEARQKMSLAGRGRKKSPDHCRRISEALKGRVLSVEHRANLSAAARAM